MIAQASNLLQTAAGLQWREIGVRQHHGICIPLFSLRSQKSCGIGEFTDLIPLIDWLPALGMDVLQLLPLNDGGLDSSPYSAISAYALNPIHLGLASLHDIDKVPDGQRLLSKLQEFNQLQRVDYRSLRPLREQFLRQYFEHAGSGITAAYDYLLFIANNPWLESFALFKALKEATHWQSWQGWPAEWSDSSSHGYQQLLRDYKQEITYHKFVQYLCHKQFHSIKKLADEKKIFLKGDIPILINRESADVWRHKSLFELELSAGAPPDMYSKEGQHWGFPLYDWKNMENRHYEWWKQRLKLASSYYHIYRIDHIVGFFRIWAIPAHKSAKEGHYIPSDPALWIPQGENIMRMMLESCRMLPIGEDLGVVPTEVRTCLSKLGICGTKVIRWERYWETDKSYISPGDYPVESMTTVSTHDADTLTLWWKNDPDEAQEYAKFKGWPYSDTLSRENLQGILWDSHHSASLFHINLLQEYLPLVPNMTWPELQDERINIPGIVSDFNWSYRFRPYVEEITSNREIADVISSCVGS